MTRLRIGAVVLTLVVLAALWGDAWQQSRQAATWGGLPTLEGTFPEAGADGAGGP